MKYLKKYQSKSAYDADYYDGKIPFPHVALVEGNVVYAEKFESVTDERTPLYIEAIEDLTVKFSVNAIEYSLDNSVWVDLPVNTVTPTVLAGSKIYFRADNLTASSSSGIGTFSITGKCKVGGNIMSMRYGADFIGKLKIGSSNAFSRLFRNQTAIVNAHRLILPAIALSSYCYQYMFYGCSNLEEAPELPANAVATYCYQYMFYGCSSLKKAPKLPAVAIDTYCYQHMFYGCSSLEEAPELPATKLSSNCYAHMFYGCSSLKKAPKLPALKAETYCYNYMFYGCSSLEEAPELPADEISTYCYQYMFYGCSSLKKAPKILPAMTLSNSCYQSMFSNCRLLQEAPELPATKLSNNCYISMFSECSSLQYIKMMSLDAPSSTYLSGWVNGVAGTGTFVKNSAATWENTYGTSAIPTGWDVVLADE